MPWSKERNRFYPTFLEEPHRFWAKVQVGSPDECWPWLGCRDSKGYGRAGKRERAHRIAYQIVHGALPEDRLVRHTCDNPPCCNPAHLLIGDHADNARDAVERGQHYSPFSSAERQRHGLVTGPSGQAVRP